MKYDRFVNNMNSHFSCVKVINFDIAHHQFCGDKLQNPHQFMKQFVIRILKIMKVIFKIKQYQQLLNLSVKIFFFDHGFLKNHIKSNIEKDLVSNGFFINKNNKKKTPMIVKN